MGRWTHRYQHRINWTVNNLTFVRKNRTREDRSKGIRPDTEKGRALAASTLMMLSRKTSSSLKAGSCLVGIVLIAGPDCVGRRWISKSDIPGALGYRNPVVGAIIEAMEREVDDYESLNGRNGSEPRAAIDGVTAMISAIALDGNDELRLAHPRC